MSDFVVVVSDLAMRAAPWATALAIGVGMGLESAGLPIPSEVVLPLGGYLVAAGRMDLGDAFWAGVAGSLAGSLVAYRLALVNGPHLIERYGHYVHLTARRLESSERWVKKYGAAAVFAGRLLPVVRSYISYPAGVVGMDWKIFTVASAVGIIPWNLALTYMGILLGRDWHLLLRPFHWASWTIIGVLAALLLVRLAVRGRNGSGGGSGDGTGGASPGGEGDQ